MESKAETHKLWRVTYTRVDLSPRTLHKVDRVADTEAQVRAELLAEDPRITILLVTFWGSRNFPYTKEP